MYASDWGEEDDGKDLSIDLEEIPARTHYQANVESLRPVTYGLTDETDDEDEDDGRDESQPAENPPMHEIGPVHTPALAHTYGFNSDEDEDDENLDEREEYFRRKAEQVGARRSLFGSGR
jgi:hypothetical protein